MNAELTKIPTSDIALITCGKVITIGTAQITIKPLSLKIIYEVSDMLIEFMKEMEDLGVTLDNFRPHIPKVIKLLMGRFLPLYEAVTRIHRESLEAVPPNVHLELIEAVISVNCDSATGFAKNWAALTTAVTKVKGLFQPQKQAA
jgi:hypothetical protein